MHIVMSQYHKNQFVLCAQCLAIAHQCWEQSNLSDTCGINEQYYGESMFTDHILG